MQSSFFPGHSSSEHLEKVTEAYLRAIHTIDDRVTPFLGKATTRVLVQGAARRIAVSYPFLQFLEKMPYTDVSPSVVREQLSGVEPLLLAAGLDALLKECFAGLKELTGNLIVPPLHEEIARQLEELP
jgi:hypothetical protein